MRITLILLASSALASMPMAAAAITTVVPTTQAETQRNDPVARAFDFLENLDDGRLFEKDYAERVLQESRSFAPANFTKATSRLAWMRLGCSPCGSRIGQRTR